MPTQVLTEPPIEPITLAEAKKHLRVDIVDEDSYISGLIVVARQAAELFTGRALITQTWKFHVDCFPLPGTCLEIPFPPLQLIESINYIPGNSSLGGFGLGFGTGFDTLRKTLSDTIYTVDSNAEMGTVTLAYDQTWPTIRNVKNAVQIQFIAGYGNDADDIPEGIRHGMKMLLGHLYERRETTMVGVPIVAVPQAYEWLLNPYRVTRFA